MKIYRKYISLFISLILVFIWGCSSKYVNKEEHQSLSQDWELFSSTQVHVADNQVSKLAFYVDDKIKAQIPTTVFSAACRQGDYPDLFLGKNLDTISSTPYKVAWWYRKVFSVDVHHRFYELQFDGINYKANIWLNGKLIADTSQVDNAFKMYRFDISKQVQAGENVLAVEVFPPRAGDFSIGFVDWNPSPPDRNMGIFRPVYLNTINKVQIVEPYVENQFINHDYSVANQIISFKLKNYQNQAVNGFVKLYMHGNLLNKNVTIPANSTIKLVLTYEDFDKLRYQNPTLWWPYTYGEPVLHDLSISFHEAGQELCETKIKYGIREVEDYFTKDGHRGFKINGKKILIRGAGWVDRMRMDNSDDYDKAQLEYVKSLNLNTIRLEGFWGNDEHLYRTCDELGILVMVGWSCHWEWEDYLGKACDVKYGGIQSDKDINMMARAWRDQVVWLRNHPSVMAWLSGSDCVPTPALEQKYKDVFHDYDSTRVYLSSAKEWEDESMHTGVKMRGPYDYEPPVYWFSDTLYGGAFGFNTETGPGAQVPPLESIKKMIPQEDLWPINDVWNFHCGRNEFNTLDRYTLALTKRYGNAEDVADYARKAQLLNYELMRPMFEAFSAHRYQATGVILWMLNSAWPEMYWQLYDSYLMPNAAFYSTKKAGEAIHALYDYEKNAIVLVNDHLTEEKDLNIEIRVYDIQSKLLFNQVITTSIEENAAKQILALPQIQALSETYFLDLRVKKASAELSNNFYWLSTKEDVLDYQAQLPTWYYHTPSKEYADFHLLNTMPKVTVTCKLSVEPTGRETLFIVEVQNQSDKIAFFIDLNILDQKTKASILPVLWSDNYISLLPHEKRIITAKINQMYLKGVKPILEYEAYNN
jgi:exo-1,4-beta-D-glucosaminidase